MFVGKTKIKKNFSNDLSSNDFYKFLYINEYILMNEYSLFHYDEIFEKVNV